MYLLAKALPHTLVSGENEKFKEELAKTEAKDIVRFAEVVGREAQGVDGKVCKKHGVGNSADSWKCQQTGSSNDGAKLSAIYTQADVTTVEKGKAWPVGSASAAKSDDLATGLLNEISATEKRTVAGLLSKTVSGAEVVEIRAVSSAMAGV